MKHRIRTALVLVVGLIASLVLSAVPAQAVTLGSYIIVFKDAVNVRATVPAVAKAYGLQVGFTYEHALKGMSARVPEGRLTALRHDPRVKYVEPDRERSIDAQTEPTGITGSPLTPTRTSTLTAPTTTGWTSTWLSSIPASICSIPT